MTAKKATTKKATKKSDKPAQAPRKAKPATQPKEKKVSALDAAAQVLEGSKEPLSAKQLIETMAAKGLWTSPGGKTPHATLFSAIMREINTKGEAARFKKAGRGQFSRA